MRILVTGAAGFIGSHLSERLIARGEEVLGLDNFDDFYSVETKRRNVSMSCDHSSFRLIEGDIRDPDCLRQLPDDIDAVAHLAAKAGVRPSIMQPVEFTSVNVMGTSELLAWVRDREIPTFLFASSSSVYGSNTRLPFSESDSVDHPISPYAATKKAGELLCHTASHLSGVTTLCLRFFTVYGPRQRPDLAIHKFARLLMEGKAVPMFGDGSTSRDYTYIDDILDGVLAGLDWSRTQTGVHEIVNLGGSKAIRLSEMIGMIADELGADLKIERLPAQAGDVRHTFADISKARHLFGYSPSTDFRAGLRCFLTGISKPE